MTRLLTAFAALLMFTTAPAHAGLITQVNLCAEAYPGVSGPVLNCTADGAFDPTSVVTDVTYSVSGLDPAGSYVGRGFVSMTPDTFRLTGALSVENYARKHRVNIDDPFVLQGMVLALGMMTDTVTVTGGSGVYNLNYILAIDGTFAADANLFSFFCAVLSIPQGVGSADSSFCASQDLKQPLMLSYSALPFGAAVTPALTMNILASVESLLADDPDLAAKGDEEVTGSAFADLGSTIHIQSLLVTDASGNPIPGITIRSGEGYTYTLDPRNGAGATAVPAPSSFALIAWGWAAFRVRRRHIGRSALT